MSGDPDPRVEEVALVQRCAAGDDDAWADLLRQYGRFLDFMVRRALAGARGRIPSPDEVDEVRDEVLAWLIADDNRVLKTYRGESRLTSWLGVVVGRRARRIARRGESLRMKTVSLDALTADAASQLVRDPGADQTPRHRALAQLADAVEKLSERDRLLIRGTFYEKRSYAELAAELGVRTDSVGQLLFRAKKRLKKHLGDSAFLEALSGFLLAGLIWLVRGNAA